MAAGELFRIIINIAGGLAFFMLGMKAMGEALEALAGGKLRDLARRLTRNRVSGFAVGTLLGFLIHSGAATILLVTFVHAGMMPLLETIPVTLGTNLGTTLSMQLISFKVGDYAFVAIALGVLAKLGASHKTARNLGTVLFGFGLLFFGMDTMSGAVIPLKESGKLEAVLTLTQSTSVYGFVLATLLSVLVTAVFQSSGATIGVLFALCNAAVFDDLRQVFPLVIGAHIGTCTATLLGSIGTNVEARRTAYVHLFFNVFGTILAALMLPFYLWAVPKTADSLVRQVANLHTIVQLVNSLAFLPFVGVFAKLIRALSPSKELPPESSYLEDSDFDTPEQAIANAMREARRMATVTRLMLVQAMAGMLRITNKPFATVIKNEHVVDMLKLSINDYLGHIACRKLSTRQSILLQHLMVTVADLERIGDHIEYIAETTEQKVIDQIWFDEDSMRLLVEQYQRLDRLLRLTILSLDPELRAFRQISEKMLEVRREFVVNNRNVRARYRQLIIDHKETALNGLYYERYLRCFERVVRHLKSIARVEQHSYFELKPDKFEFKAGMASLHGVPASRPLAIDDSLLCEDLRFDDLGIDIVLLEPQVSRPSAISKPE